MVRVDLHYNLSICPFVILCVATFSNSLRLYPFDTPYKQTY